MRSHAFDLFKFSGFHAYLNDVGLITALPKGHKAVPFRVAADARIAEDDVEILATNFTRKGREVGLP